LLVSGSYAEISAAPVWPISIDPTSENVDGSSLTKNSGSSAVFFLQPINAEIIKIESRVH
jgi:hypothetical protein